MGAAMAGKGMSGRCWDADGGAGGGVGVRGYLM